MPRHQTRHAWKEIPLGVHDEQPATNRAPTRPYTHGGVTLQFFPDIPRSPPRGPYESARGPCESACNLTSPPAGRNWRGSESRNASQQLPLSPCAIKFCRRAEPAPVLPNTRIGASISRIMTTRRCPCRADSSESRQGGHCGARKVPPGRRRCAVAAVRGVPGRIVRFLRLE